MNNGIATIATFLLAAGLVHAKRNIVPKVAIVKGVLRDTRDQTEYETVKIGSQWWMAKNLDYSTGSSSCYDNDAANCKKYGRLYDWDAARSACPEGWHLPTEAEWDVLAQTVGGANVASKMLKSKSGWKSKGNGVDAFGFSALPAGRRYPDGSFAWVGNAAFFWSSTENDAKDAWGRFLDAGDEALRRHSNETYGFSVRCLKD
jgi:uncharacterized protein (TIGR02145 family)